MAELADQMHVELQGRLVPDCTVTEGSCRIRGQAMAVNISLDERFATLRDEVLRVAGKE